MKFSVLENYVLQIVFTIPKAGTVLASFLDKCFVRVRFVVLHHG